MYNDALQVPHPSESASKGAEYYPKKWEEETVRILVTGKTGTGKSALINGIIGAEVAEETCTHEMKEFEYSHHDMKFVIWDTPGLQDTVEVQGEYMKKMQRAGCGNADIVLYCTRMDDTRLRSDDIEAIKVLTDGFGEQIWRHALFILTFANRVEKRIRRPKKGEPKKSEEEIQQIQRDCFKERIEYWTKELGKVLRETGVSSENIIVVPAGYGTEIGLPDRENWLLSLFLCLYEQAGLLDQKKQLECLKKFNKDFEDYAEPQAKGCNIS